MNPTCAPAAIDWISREDAARAGPIETRVLLEQNAGLVPEFARFLDRELSNAEGSLYFRGVSGRVYRALMLEDATSEMGAVLRRFEMRELTDHGQPSADGDTTARDLWPFLEWLVAGVGVEWSVDALRQTGAIYRVPGAPERVEKPVLPKPVVEDSGLESEPGSDPFDYAYEPWVPPPFQPEHRFFETDDGVRLHYVEWPSDPGAPVVLMVHGRRAHARWFDPVIEALTPRYRCVSIDLRGHGDSGNRGATDLNRYAKDLAQWFGMFEGRRILFAHSMAGRVAILAHQNHGVQPDLLIMADTPLARRPHHFRPEPPFVNKKYPSKETAIRRFRLMPPGTSANPELLLYVGEHSIRENEDGTWSWKFNDEGTSRPVGMKLPDWAELGVEGIMCPTLVIYGEHSILVTPEDAEATAKRFPHCIVVGVREAYHHLMLDRPKAFNEEVLRFLRNNGL